MEIKHLYNFSRLPENEGKLLLCVLYLPIGAILLVLRSILLLFVILLSQLGIDSVVWKSFIHKVTCLCFGITITVENPKDCEKLEVYVSNGVSAFDKFVIHLATGAICPGIRLPLEQLMFIGGFQVDASPNSEQFRNKIEELVRTKKVPLYLAPEGKITNGKALLKFENYPFQFASRIQPICIRIQRPFLELPVTTFGSSFMDDAICFMFSPITRYKIKFLAPLEKKSLPDAEFAEIVRQNIAADLKVEKTNFTSADLSEWEKRKKQEDRQRTLAASRPQNNELQRMTLQVKEVLPHVPYNVILNDLCNTKSVDTTITNILEGRIQFTPEPLQQISSFNQPSTSSTRTTERSPSKALSSTAQFNTASTSFPSSAAERSRTFQERKEQLIAAARRRYIEKHNLDIPF